MSDMPPNFLNAFFHNLPVVMTVHKTSGKNSTKGRFHTEVLDSFGIQMTDLVPLPYLGNQIPGRDPF